MQLLIVVAKVILCTDSEIQNSDDYLHFFGSCTFISILNIVYVH